MLVETRKQAQRSMFVVARVKPWQSFNAKLASKQQHNTSIGKKKSAYMYTKYNNY